jgi:hypothetical protein
MEYNIKKPKSHVSVPLDLYSGHKKGNPETTKLQQRKKPNPIPSGIHQTSPKKQSNSGTAIQIQQVDTQLIIKVKIYRKRHFSFGATPNEKKF